MDESPLNHNIFNLSLINCVNQLSIKFFDATPQDYNAIKKRFPNSSEQEDFFNEKHAKTIINYLEQIKYAHTLIIHCAAGISRSGAVGLFSNRYFKLSEKDFRRNNPKICPNPYILDTLNRVSGINAHYEQFWKDSFKKNDRMRHINNIKFSKL